MPRPGAFGLFAAADFATIAGSRTKSPPMRHQGCKILSVNSGLGAGEEIVMFELKKFLSLTSFRTAAAFSDFDKILNWKLLRGSHLFPGPDGGTCINEAAILAAGHPYRTVRSVEDCPESFCPI